MNILLTNTVLLNGGDAAIMIAIVQQLRQAFGPETRIVIAEAMPAAAGARYPEFDIRETLVDTLLAPARPGPLRRMWGVLRFLRWHLARPRVVVAARLHVAGWPHLARLLLTPRQRSAFEAIAGADLVVSTGGTYLVEHYSLLPRIFEFEIALRLGKPLVLYTQSMGPFRRPGHRRRLRWIFDRARLLLLRDGKSFAHMRDLGVTHDRAHVLPDVVFALDAHPPTRNAGASPRVAVSVRTWGHFASRPADDGMAAYRAAVARAVEHLVRQHDAEVVFLSTCQGEPAYRIDDAAEGRTIAGLLPEDIRPRVRVDGDFHRPEALVDLLAGFDLVVATRMHMAILAMLAGTPVIPIVYEFKTRELMDRVGYAAWAGTHLLPDIDTLTLDTLIAPIDTLLARLPQARQRLAQEVRGVREEAGGAIRLLRAVETELHG